MTQNKENAPLTDIRILSIISRLSYREDPQQSPRTKADVLIEDAIARIQIAKAVKKLEEKISE